MYKPALVKAMELKELKMLARGGQAEIYELGEDKVLRVLRDKADEYNLRIEMSIMKALGAKNKAVPKVYEYLEVEGRPSLVIERIHGVSMLDQLKKEPLKLFKLAEKLAELHMEITESAEGLGLPTIGGRAAYLIPRAELLTPKLKTFALDILAGLPEGNDICHGDFHPGNIIVSDGSYYIIDWFGANAGPKISDIAHSYLLLRNTPRIPGMSSFKHFIIKHTAVLLSGRYLKACNKLCPFELRDLSKWLIIRASERVMYGHASEKEALIKFLNKCMAAYDMGVMPDKWWKYI